MRRHLKTELRSLGGYDHFFRQLQQFLPVPQQVGRAVLALDEQLERIWGSYAAFHQRWLEYCAAKEPIFAMVHAVADRSNAQVRRILGAVVALDGGAVGDLRATFDLDRPQQDPPDSPEEEDTDEAPFHVGLSQPVSIGDVTLKINTQFVVIDAAGDRWKVRDKMDRVWRRSEEDPHGARHMAGELVSQLQSTPVTWKSVQTHEGHARQQYEMSQPPQSAAIPYLHSWP
jgi:hypothetical protein